MSARVWEPFLTHQDIGHFERQAPSRQGYGTRPALLMIDLYRSVFGDRPEPIEVASSRWPSSCGLAAWKALPAIVELLSEARAAHIPVIHVTGTSDIPPWRRPRLNAGDESGSLLDKELAPDAKSFEIIPELAPIVGELHMTKAAPSAFWGSPLLGCLRQLDIDSLIVCGESTSGCVRATVVDACSYRYKVTVVEDCVFDRLESSHALSLFDISEKAYGDVTSLADVAAHLQSLSPSTQ